MPVYLRRFYYKQLADTKKEENEAIEKANKKSKGVSPGQSPNQSKSRVYKASFQK